MAQALIEKGAQINAKESDGAIALIMLAAGKGNTEIVKLLLANGADVNAKTKDGYSVYDGAVESKSPETIQIIKEFSKRK